MTATSNTAATSTAAETMAAETTAAATTAAATTAAANTAAANTGRDPSVAVLGIGIMGSAMARNLLKAGLRTSVWDRSAASTARLAESGARAAASPQEAVRDADVVITMLPTAEVVTSVMLDGDVVGAFARGATWAQMGTIGVEATDQLGSRVAKIRPDVLFVDAPVSGTKGPAETGQLLILASGPETAEPILRPAFAAMGRSAMWLGAAGQGSRMKLAINAYLAALIEGVAEALTLAERLGVDPAKLGGVIEGGPLDAPLAGAKLHKMERGDFSPEFPLEWALKDVDLALAAAGEDSLPSLAALSRTWHSAVKAGHGREDVSAAVLALSR
jgi:3-hydroxyisobutyrate dehydrogenase